MNFIRDILNHREQVRENRHRRAMEVLLEAQKVFMKVSDMHIAKSQSKCQRCKHKFEEVETFHKGGLVFPRGEEKILLNVNKNAEMKAGLKRLEDMLETHRKNNPPAEKKYKRK